MNKNIFALGFAIGLAAVTWVALGFIGSSWLALTITALIALVYALGALELRQFRAATASLAQALVNIPQPLVELDSWLSGVPASLQNSVRLRIAGERASLPGPALTPYLVGLLVMLGMLGTFLGMVLTFKGAVFALEGSTDLHAIRSALAAPIKGLGLSFGTSVAGVAASAMLGLLSALSRRERVEAGRLLDSRISTVLRPFSLAHQRQENFKALQVQAGAMPAVVSSLQALMDGMERRMQQMNEQMLGSQAQFHREVSLAYTGLANTVGQSLTESLSASARIAGDSLKPIVQAAMSEIAQESRRLHEREREAAQTQMNQLIKAFDATANTVSQAWGSALQNQLRSSETQTQSLERALLSFTDNFEQRATALVNSVSQAAARTQSEAVAADQQRLAAWTLSLQAMADRLHSQFQEAGAQAQAQQQVMRQTLEQNAAAISEQASRHASQTLGDVARLLAQSEALVSARIDAEERWTQQHGQRMEQLTSLMRSELGALRDDEATRGNAAVERLAELQSAVTSHLATLGAALEAPMTRLMQTASEVPQAAAGVITQLREELSHITVRDTQALQERSVLMDKINTLLQTLQETSGEQAASIEALATAAATVMDQASRQFADTLGAQAGQSEAQAAQVMASAVELASLGEAFNHGVQLFSASNEKLVDGLQRIEGSLGRSMARSDEQLAYYVAQAREVIDLSISAQQGVIEDLQRLHKRQPAMAEELAQ